VLLLFQAALGDGNKQVKAYFKKAVSAGQPIKKLIISRDQQSLYVGTPNKVRESFFHEQL